LAGERAHYELAAGNTDEAARIAGIMRAQTSPGGLIPEQIWDAPDIHERELVNGRPSGSAMPLVWAHAEYVKLARSLRDGHVFDMPPQTVRRYVESEHHAPFIAWSFSNQLRTLPAGAKLRVETCAPSVIHWSHDAWRTVHDVEAVDTTLGIWYADLPTDGLVDGTEVVMTFYWPDARRWEEKNILLTIASAVARGQPRC
jgi:glucoamylase